MEHRVLFACQQTLIVAALGLPWISASSPKLEPSPIDPTYVSLTNICIEINTIIVNFATL